jgi:hypothetical protein
MYQSSHVSHVEHTNLVVSWLSQTPFTLTRLKEVSVPDSLLPATWRCSELVAPEIDIGKYTVDTHLLWVNRNKNQRQK